MTLNQNLSAPIIKGKRYGTVQLMLKGNTIAQAPLIALKNDPRGGLWTRTTDHVMRFFSELFG